MKKQILALVCGVVFSGSTWAHNLQLEQSLPSVKVSEYGEIVLAGKDTAFQPWGSAELAGKVRVVHHLAGRTAAKEKNQPMIDAIKASHFNPVNTKQRLLLMRMMRLLVQVYL